MTVIAQDNDAYLAIAPATLVPEAVADFSLYIRGAATEYRLYRGAGYPFEDHDRQKLIADGVERLYIPCHDRDRYQSYLRTHLDAILADEQIPVRDRFGGLNEVVRHVLQETFVKGEVAQAVGTATEMSSQIVGMVCRDDTVSSDLLSVVYHDYHTFTHSANVSYFSVFLARRFGIDDPQQLRQIAAGGLLHDLGKLSIPEKLLNKPGRLSEDEFAVIRRHPVTGFRSLGRRDDLTFGQLMMVYQHHEDWEGGGYPVGLVGGEIHLWGRICTVADVFEALTSNRPYRKGMPPAAALNLMDTRMRNKFEPELLACFKAAIANI